MNTSSDSQKPYCNPSDYPGLDVYAVVGNPIAHSRSPEIHAMFAEQTNQAIHYGKLFSELDQFEKTVKHFFTTGGKGLNVTVPFKANAYALCEQLTDRAKAAEVVNVLWQENGVLHGDNSDGMGLVRDLKRNAGSLKGRRILLLGAGGAAQGVVLPLINESPSELIISNRTQEKATRIVQQFAKLASSQNVIFRSEPIETLETLGAFDIVINATASGLTSTSPISDQQVQALVGNRQDHCFAYDMLYGKPTPFMQQFLKNKATVLDGMGMLVEQAAQAFETWRGPSVVGKLNTEAVLKKLRQS